MMERLTTLVFVVLAFCLGAIVQAVHEIASMAVVIVMVCAWVLAIVGVARAFGAVREQQECWFCHEEFDADLLVCPHCKAAQ